MILFTKPDCERCDWIKANCDLADVSIQELAESPEALALLAYYECVTLAQKSLPILVIDNGPFDGRVLTEIGEIAAKLNTGACSTEFEGSCGEACAL